MSATEVEKSSGARSEALFGVATVVLAIIFLIAINNQEWIESRTSDSMGTGFVPRLGVYMVAAGALVLLLENWLHPHAIISGASVPHGLIADFAYPAIVAVTYIYAVYSLGFVVVTAVMLPLYLYTSGIRRLKTFIPVSVVGTLLMYIFFMRMLTLFFPRARLF